MNAPVMTPRRPDSAEERRLWRRVEQGDAAAREEMILRNLGLVRSLAARDRGRGVAFDDLVQEVTGAWIESVDSIMDRTNGTDRGVDPVGDQVYCLGGVLLGGRERWQRGGRCYRVGSPIRNGVEGAHPLGDSVAGFACDVDDFVEL